jgi:hypothetical protein
MKTDPDPAIQEIREVRHQISAEFDHDPRKLLKFYMEFQKQYADRLIKAPVKRDCPDPMDTKTSDREKP